MLHHVVNMGKSTEYFSIAVSDHDGADHQAQDEKSQRLQTIKNAQEVPSE
jgi:hypothetical protein